MEKKIEELDKIVSDLTALVITLQKDVEMIKKGEHYTGIYLDGADEATKEYLMSGDEDANS